MRDFLTVDDLQRILGVGRDWIMERVNRGEIPKVPNMGRYVHFHPDEIERIFRPTCSLTIQPKHKAGHKQLQLKGEHLWQV